MNGLGVVGNRIAELEATVAELEATVHDLREAMRKPEGFPAHWRLSPHQNRMLSLLTRHGSATKAALAMAAPHVLKGHVTGNAIARLREAVGPHGITILSSYGDGYYLPPKSLDRARAAIGFAPSVEK